MTGALSGIMDSLVNFRSDIRKEAIGMMRAKELPLAKEAAKKILEHCDGIRDNDLPKFGVQIEDKNNTSIWKQVNLVDKEN